MDYEHSVNDMPLTLVIKRWLAEKGWKDEVQVDLENLTSKVETTIGVNNQPYELYINAVERSEIVYVSMYTPFNVALSRLPELATIMNRINCRLSIGRFACGNYEDVNQIQFQVGIDIEGSSLGVKQIDNMVSAACTACRYYEGVLAAIAFTDQSADKAWKRFIKCKDEETNTEDDDNKSEDESSDTEDD